MNRKFGKAITALKLLTAFTLLGAVVAYDNTLELDFPGPYCAAKNICCKNREDGCAMPISSKYFACFYILIYCLSGGHISQVFKYLYGRIIPFAKLSELT